MDVVIREISFHSMSEMSDISRFPKSRWLHAEFPFGILELTLQREKERERDWEAKIEKERERSR